MKIVIVDNGSKYTTALMKLVHHYPHVVVDYRDLDYKQLDRNNIVILTGGHNKPILWHSREYARETAVVKRHKGPIIGICLGFELIAHIYGSHLHLYNERRKGEVLLEPLSQVNVTTLALPSSVLVYENHNWSVLKLKRPLKPLAVSKDGIEIFKHVRKPIYGMQFHPEESSMGGTAIFQQIFDEALKHVS